MSEAGEHLNQLSHEDQLSHGDQLSDERRGKVAKLREAGVDPYPVGVRVDHRLAEVTSAWGDRLQPGEESGTVVRVGGRLVAKRGHGKLVFAVVREGDAELQVMCALDSLGEATMDLVDLLDLGDWVAAEGGVIRTKRGELSVRATGFTLIGKSLRPMPDKWHGLTDTEVRYRQREVDLAVNPETRRVFAIRAAVLSALRAEMAERGYLEVETPMLHPIPGGATARPFVTHHNALDTDLYLRIAPELYLKRLIAGGMDRVFEINRSFRNEGLSPRHNPEFTMLESYEAYADYCDMMSLTQALIQRAATAATGSTTVTFEGAEIDLGGEWPRRTVVDLVGEATGTDVDLDTSIEDLRGVCEAHGVGWEDSWGPGRLVEELRDEVVEPRLRQPTFVIDYPVEVSPLARRHRDDPRLTERFELIVAGREMANAFSELTDPVDQRERFTAQGRAREAGDQEAMGIDEPYLRAMEFGMPPMGGLGVGVDRLVMLLADVSAIRDVILFPSLRRE
jgi:lysyl-tRNA synthetase class 2